MKKYKILTIMALVSLMVILSCQKQDYYLDGGTANDHVNVTTYDFLKSNPLFDTLVLLIDRCNLKDEVNKAGTFFAVTDYSVVQYVQKTKDEIRTQKNDFSYPWNLDSCLQPRWIDHIKDSLRMYMFAQRIERSNLTTEITRYTPTNGADMAIYLEKSNLYTEYSPSSKIYFVTIRRIVNGKIDMEALTGSKQDVYNEADIENRCQTSGIITTTGVLHVLADTHCFTFKRIWVDDTGN